MNSTEVLRQPPLAQRMMGSLGVLERSAGQVEGVGGQGGGFLARGGVGAGAGVGMGVPVGEAEGLLGGAVDGLDGEGDGVAAGAAVDGDLRAGRGCPGVVGGLRGRRGGVDAGFAAAGCWAGSVRTNESRARDERAGLMRMVIGFPQGMDTRNLTHTVEEGANGGSGRMWVVCGAFWIPARAML